MGTLIIQLEKPCKLQISDFLGCIQGSWICRTNYHPRSRKDRHLRNTAIEICRPRAETSWARNWQGHRHGDFEELSEAESGLSWEKEPPQAVVLGPHTNIHTPSLQEPRQILAVRIWERSPHSFDKWKERTAIVRDATALSVTMLTVQTKGLCQSSILKPHLNWEKKLFPLLAFPRRSVLSKEKQFSKILKIKNRIITIVQRG